MKILQINSLDQGGGAERIASDLHLAYQKQGVPSCLMVGRKRKPESDTVEMARPHPPAWWANFCWKLHGRLEPYQARSKVAASLRSTLHTLAQGIPGVQMAQGLEPSFYPGSRHILKQSPFIPDLIHVHNLHGYYFDLSFLPYLSTHYPLLVTLHDEWLYTGHCAYTMGCARWQTGCGACPDLTIYPAIGRDQTAANWKRKQKIYRRSRLYLATPSRWLMERVERSMLQAVEKRVIPNGVDLEVFQPNEDRVTARKALNLPAEGFIGLYVAVSGSGNPFKDYSTIQKTISNLTQPRNEPVYFVVLGGDCEKMEERDGFQYYFRPFQPDARKVALYYRAADVFLHATKADNFPTVILEALACGTPVVATAVGGIPEQIRDGETGFLVPAGDAQAMADKLQYLMSEPALLQQMGARAAADARQRFGLERQAAAYLSWYEEIIEGWKKQHASH